MYKNIINNVVPADDLHWDSMENKYVSLSEEETKEIISACIEQGITELEDVFAMVSWCGTIRIGQILWKNFLSGSVKISGFDNGEPLFSARKDEK
jgi:hypothetical protein